MLCRAGDFAIVGLSHTGQGMGFICGVLLMYMGEDDVPPACLDTPALQAESISRVHEAFVAFCGRLF